MKTITISVDDETYRRCHRRAEAAGTSVETWAATRLAELASQPVSEAEFERLRQLQNKVLGDMDARGIGFPAADRLSRDELYDRNAFR